MATPDDRPRAHAAIDVGSTSVHLLAALPRDGGLEPLVDESAFLGFGAAVDARGLLGPERIGALVAALRELAGHSEEAGAGAPVIVGTEAVRRALDAATAVRAVERGTGLALHVLTQREEALLTLIGVIGGRAPAVAMAVVDIGGGSTEVVLARPGAAPTVGGLPVGAERLLDRQVAAGSGGGSAGTLEEVARAAVAAAPEGMPAELVAVGGTADNLAKVAGGARGALTRDRLTAILERLASQSAVDVAEAFGLRPERVRLLPGGGAILLALLDRYGLDTVRVSGAGLRDGAILATAAAGAGWRDALERLATGSPPRGPGGDGTRDPRPLATAARPSAGAARPPRRAT